LGIGGKPEAKYLLPHGYSRCAYILSADHDQLLSDHTTTILFVEAEKSKLALTALFRRRGLNLVAIAVAWIDGRAGKHETASGERVPEKGVIRGVGLASNGRRAIVLFDRNMKSNP